ncbi:MAG: hypothetical protein AAAB16_16645 [Pseudomonas sp.]|uniref:hypothetical protein n=1 Tax=Pseudomonas sp. TaxID=306 RepID=UPI0030F0C530
MNLRARLLPVLAVGPLCLGLQGCSTPAMEAFVNYNPEPLQQSLVTRQVGVNDYLLLDTAGGYLTPLCLMAFNFSPTAINSIDYLLANGADVNQPCGRGNSYSGYTALDFAVDQAYEFQKTLNPYIGPRTKPSKTPIFMATVAKLRAHGGGSLRGSDSPEAIAAQFKSWNGSNDAFVEKWAADIRREEAESKKNSLFTAENLSAVAAVAGTATALYANQAQSAGNVAALAPATQALRSSTSNVGSAAVATRPADASATSLQNMAGINAATDNARATRGQQLDQIVAKVAADGGMKTMVASYRCSAEEPLQSVTVPYKTEACRAAKQNWFAVYACNEVASMSAANEQCRQGCGNVNCDEGQ